MYRFRTFISEATASKQTKANAENTAMGDAYETGTVLHIHDNTASSLNPNRNYRSKINDVRKKYKAALASLSPDRAENAKKNAEASGQAYLASLHKNHGVTPDRIHQVYHTSNGIGDHLEGEATREKNPHDVLVKGFKKDQPFMHGASLKGGKSSTISNNTVAAFTRRSHQHGINVNTAEIWQQAKEKADLGDLKNKKNAEKQEQHIQSVKRQAQRQAAEDHAKSFNYASHPNQKRHLLQLMKANPDLGYDYVKSYAGRGSSTPHHRMPHAKAVKSSEHLKATVAGTIVNFHDHKGNHILSVEHRTTKKGLAGAVANAKLGTMK